MNISLDLFSQTNPAFCSCILYEYVRGFNEASGEGVDFPLLFLPLPIALSENLEKTFQRTNRNTGFFEWINRSPEIPLGLDERIAGTALLTQNAIRFGLQAGVLRFSGGRFYARPEGFKSHSSLKKYKTVVENLSRARRLGHWFGGARSTFTILNSLGVAV